MLKSEAEGNKDINDVFSDLLLCEEQVIKESYKEGYKQGVSEANFEGFHLGFHRGAEVGVELGYYKGVLEAFHIKPIEDAVSSEKIKNIVTQLQSMVDTYPQTNTEDVDLIQLLDDIRVKFRKLCSLLRIQAIFPKTDNLSF